MKLLLFYLYLFFHFSLLGQDTTFIKVHFLHGSKPKKKYQMEEKKWFGGYYGGHVGIQFDSTKIINFIPKGSFHYFENKKDFHSSFTIHTTNNFWKIFPCSSDSVEKTTIKIPINLEQKLKLDSIVKSYIDTCPYDYAFFGMRCGSATYDILSQLGIVSKYSHRKTYLKLFYPKKVRKLLLKKAATQKWEVFHKKGTVKRKWEHDN